MRFLRVILATALLAAGGLSLSLASACFSGDAATSDAGGGDGGAARPPIDDVVFEGTTNDEALVAMLALAAEANPARAARWSAPADGAKLPASAAATFAWDPPAPTATRESEPTPWDEALRALAALEGTAFAHGAAVNGRAYLLVFANPKGEAVLRVFTSLTAYTPTSSKWQRLVDAKAPLTVTLTTGAYDNNTMLQGGGPYASAPRAVSLE